MSAPVTSEVSLEGKLQELEKQLQAGTPDAKQFRSVYDGLKKLNRRLQELLQWAVEQRRDEKELNNLYCQVAGWNASDLVEHLKRTGFRLK